MANLETKFVGLTLKSPIVIASSGLTETVEKMSYCQENGAGAVVMKSYFEQEVCRNSPTPAFKIINHDMGNKKTFTFYSYEQASQWDIRRYAEEVRRAVNELEIKIFPSLNCLTEEGWVEGAKMLQDAGAHAIELNTSCPHGSITFRGGAVEETILKTCEAVRKAVSIPVIAKLSPMLTSPGGVAKACEDIGMNAVTIFNRFTGLEIDVEAEAPIMHGTYAGHGGPWAIQYPLRWISQIRPSLNIDIAGSGGVVAPDDLMKYLLVGANAVQVCTAVYLEGYEVIGELLKGLGERMEKKGYKELDDFRGRVVGKILTTDTVDRRKRFRAHKREGWAAPCRAACPAGVPAQSYVRLAAEGRFDEALDMVRLRNPFQSICGRACYAPCEDACTRGLMDGAIAIRSIKRFLCDWGRENRPLSKEVVRCAPDSGKKVAILGAGPAGLSAAHDLALMGHAVTVFEAESVAGGMMRMAIPEYRLPSDYVDEEIDFIKSLGVDIRLNQRLGRDISLESLKKEYDSVLLAVGTQKAMSLNLPGEDAEGVISALDFLKDIRLNGMKKVDGRVVVVGGGNSALDAARSAIRLGAKEVFLVYRRTRQEMPASEEEIHDAELEGVKVMYLVTPLEIVTENGMAAGLRCRGGYLDKPTGEGRRRPMQVEEAEFTLPADLVLKALGQVTDQAIFDEKPHLPQEQGSIGCNEMTRMTSVAGMFAAGDAAGRPASIIEAIADGKRSALYIDAYLGGENMNTIEEIDTSRQSHRVEPWAVIKRSGDVEEKARVEIPKISAEEALKGFNEVELPLTAEQVMAEAERCLACGCGVGCGKCARVCNYRAIEQVDADYVVDAEKCEGCGMCLERCPNGVIELVERD